MKLVTDDGIEIEIEKLRAIEVRPEDVVHIALNGKLSSDTLRRVSDRMKNVFPNMTVIITEDGIGLKVMREKGE